MEKLMVMQTLEKKQQMINFKVIEAFDDYVTLHHFSMLHVLIYTVTLLGMW